MRLLDEDPPFRRDRRRVGASNGAAHYCVTALIDKGFEAKTLRDPKPGQLYDGSHRAALG